MERIVFNVKEIAKYLSVSESTIRKLIREKKIPHFRIYSKILFDK
ncbi:DNA-binding protein [bacterium]|nr:DNA-binding protein [bacterium]